jgi:hypothetical protein
MKNEMGSVSKSGEKVSSSKETSEVVPLSSWDHVHICSACGKTKVGESIPHSALASVISPGTASSFP